MRTAALISVRSVAWNAMSVKHPCKCQEGTIFPLYITCRYGCGRSYHLKIFPSGEVNLQ